MTATRNPDRLFELLPAVYREQDADNNGSLQALLRIITSQVDVVEQDVAGLWDDLFIETCRRWVIPYIGDLVSNDLLYDAGRIADADTAAALFTDLRGPDLRPPVAIRTRTDVAKTIYYRRRKGTLPMLEELARDVTGWAAHAVEFFELLGWMQNLEHIRTQAGWFDLRSLERDERVDGPFDVASHTVDVRPISQDEGWHSIRNVGFFLWRLGSYPLLNVPARGAGAAWQFHFSPLGNDAHLFTHLRREGDEAGLSTELHVPGPIRRAFFKADLDAHRTPPPDFTDLYGAIAEAPPLESNPDASLFVIRNGTPVPPKEIVCMRLDPWPAARPAGKIIGVDVVNGRLAVGNGYAGASTLDVSFHYGFPADIGGGSYERRKWLVADDPASPLLRLQVEEGVSVFPTVFPTVVDALNHWASAPVGRPDCVISVMDSRTYPLPSSITLADTTRLAIEARNGERPVLTAPAGGFKVDADATNPDPEQRGRFALSGVVVEGFVRVTGDLAELRILHSTIVPGRSIAEGAAPSTAASIIADATSGAGAQLNAHLALELASSISGPIECPEDARGVWILDSIVDGLGGRALGDGSATGHAAPLTTERSTFLGTVRVHELEASESIFTGLIDTVRTQEGCVRFSFVPRGSRTPRRHRCQPDLRIRHELDAALVGNPALTQPEQNAIKAYVATWLVPAFVTTQYGQPAYCQLRLRAPLEIRTGAADGSEMGAYCQLKQPQRESNLRIRLDEYLPFGLEAGLIYVT